MRFNCVSEREEVALRTLRRVLNSDDRLCNAFTDIGVDIGRLEDAHYADYLGDWLVQELGDRVANCNAVEQALRKQLLIRADCTGRMQGTIKDQWERYPLEFLLRLIWRHRGEAWQMRFMKGPWYNTDLPDMWQLEIRQECDRYILHCHSYTDGSYLQMVISGTPFAVDFPDFCRNIREFLDIPCGTVWLSGVTTLRMEVQQ